MARRSQFYSILIVLALGIGWAVYALMTRTPAPAAQVTPVQIQKKKKPHSWTRFSRAQGTEAEVKVGAELKAEALIQQIMETLIALLDQGRDRDFLNYLEEVLKQNPDVPEFWAIRADFYYAMEDWDKTEESLGEVLRLDPSNEFAKTSLGEVNAITGKFDEGMSRMKEVLEVNPSNLEALYGLLSISELQERPELGAEMVRDLYSRHPESANIAMVMSDVLASERNWAERTKVLEKAMRDEPQNPGPYRLAASDAYRLGQLRRAVELGERSLQLETSEDHKISTLDVLIQSSLSLRDRERAQKYIEIKKKLNPYDLALPEQEALARE